MVFAWSQLKCGGSVPSERTNAVFSFDGKSLYLFGGLSDSVCSIMHFSWKLTRQVKFNEMYQLVLDGKTVWRSVGQKGDLPSPRDGHAFTFVQNVNQFYLFGGSDTEDKQLNDFYTFDPTSLGWKAGSSRFLYHPHHENFHYLIIFATYQRSEVHRRPSTSFLPCHGCCGRIRVSLRRLPGWCCCGGSLQI